MGQYMIWYALQLKAWVRRKTSWMQVLGMILLVLLTARIQLPDAKNTRVGVCSAPDEYAGRVLECLRARDSIFEFIEYPEEAAMRRDLVSGRIECGFVFSENFQELAEGDRLKDSVIYICTPFSVKGLVAQETFYAAFFEMYSEKILIGSETELYGRSDESLTEALLEKRRGYLQDGEMFRMDIVETGASSETRPKQVESGASSETQPKQGKAGASSEPRPVQGMAGLFVFAVLWVAQGRKFGSNGNGILSALDQGRRWKFRYLGALAEATVPAAVGLALILLMPGHRGAGRETVSMVLFVLVCSFWVPAVSRLFRNSTAFAGWTLTILLLQMAVCPVFVDLAAYIPAVKVIRWGFPLGWLG